MASFQRERCGHRLRQIAKIYAGPYGSATSTHHPTQSSCLQCLFTRFGPNDAAARFSSKTALRREESARTRISLRLVRFASIVGPAAAPNLYKDIGQSK